MSNQQLYPNAPKWFYNNIEYPYKNKYVTVENCKIHYLLFQEQNNAEKNLNKPGLILVHGNGAHAHWYTFIAPFFVQDYNVVALSNSGNGLSGWREMYPFTTWGEEVYGVAKDAGMFNNYPNQKPIVAAHSMGTVVAMALGKMKDKIKYFSGFLLLDELPRPPGYFDDFQFFAPTTSSTSSTTTRPPPPPRPPRKGHKVRDKSISVRTKFYLQPPQKVMHPFIKDYIADYSITFNEDKTTWTWSFDPKKNFKQPKHDAFPLNLMDYLSVENVQKLPIRVAFIVGERSAICNPAIVDFNRSVLGNDIPINILHDSAHHVMLDQPLALTASMKGILNEWKRSKISVPAGSNTYNDPPISNRIHIEGEYYNRTEPITWKNSSKL